MQGWVITKDHFANGDDSRVGVGQVDKTTVQAEAEQVFGRTITIDENLPTDLDNPIPFKLFGDDGDLAYSGFISEEWLDDDVLAFSPLKFGEVDYGTTIMKYKRDGEWHHL